MLTVGRATAPIPATLPASSKRGTSTVYAVAAILILTLLTAALLPRHSVGQAGGAVLQRQALEAAQPLALQEAPIPPDFRYNKVVAIVAFDRYHYFRHVIKGLLEAWGSADYIVTVTVDGPPANASAFDQQGRESIIEYSQQLQWLSRKGYGGFKDVLINASDSNLGVWPNKKRAVAAAFNLSDFVIVLEDDIVLERDALRWFEWHVTSGLIFRQPELATAACWAKPFPFSELAVEGLDLLAVHTLGMLDKYFLNPWSTPWGWATWRRTWDVVGANWTGRDVHLGRMVKQQGWVESMPLVARCNNIGGVGFHKKGTSLGHVHQRTITTAAFHGLHRCVYTEVPNPTRALLPEPYSKLVRFGILPRGGNQPRLQQLTMEEMQATMETYLSQQGLPTPPPSTC